MKIYFLVIGPINVTYHTIFKMFKTLQSNRSSEIKRNRGRERGKKEIKRNNWLPLTTGVKEIHYQAFLIERILKRKCEKPIRD